MTRYLAVFTGSPDAFAAWMALPEEERRRRDLAGMAAWQRWVEDHRAAIVEMGGPLGRTTRVTADGPAEIRNAMAAFTVVQAESREAAAAMFEGHPHFMLFPGDGVEVMEILPIPGAPAGG